jgi:hypothetical protein
LILLVYVREERMSTEAERFAQLRQMGFVDVDKWQWSAHGLTEAEEQQQQLLAVLRNEPQATELK